ncbi:MAG: HDIG domain-containing protein, partial [Niameybacter sp.]
FFVGIVIVVLVVGSLPLWEAAFGFITPLQLLELTNPNQPVLKRLLIEATGTYYHSLLVANLAETAADEIGANALMVRVGGYYHDIGKLTCSNYFKENQVLDNPHDYLDPKSSVDIILSHVTSGIELANAYKLPKCVKDMIKEHHGTGCAQYFYVKAKNIEGEAIDLKDFTYEGPKPQTKESGLIMLADVVEATVRAMQHKIGKEVTVEEIVRKMVKQKLDEGQLDECPLYISDIEKIIQSFTRMLNGMYHERIEYPERKDK